MNRERMLKLASAMALGRVGVRFSMRFLCSNSFAVVGDHMECGTACCIAGMACLMYGEKGDDISSAIAMSLLDLNVDQSSRLFFNTDHFVSPKDDWKDIAKKEAVAAIRRMVREG